SAGFRKKKLSPVVVRRTRRTNSSEGWAKESPHHHPAPAPGRRAAAPPPAPGHLQTAGGRPGPPQESLPPDPPAAQTPLRADSEPSRSRQGLHGPREGDARLRHQGPQHRDGGRAESRRQPQRPGGHEGA